jgi:hypothetical protein
MLHGPAAHIRFEFFERNPLGKRHDDRLDGLLYFLRKRRLGFNDRRCGGANSYAGRFRDRRSGARQRYGLLSPWGERWKGSGLIGEAETAYFAHHGVPADAFAKRSRDFRRALSVEP